MKISQFPLNLFKNENVVYRFAQKSEGDRPSLFACYVHIRDTTYLTYSVCR